MSNYPDDVRVSDPRAPWNAKPFPECDVCGQENSPRRACETCDLSACEDCRQTCGNCRAWTCYTHLSEGLCPACVKKAEEEAAP